ncbi:MAG: SDR family oxidoreductase [Deltaproteobacteria bacterium]|jgi:NAD(P)-dependent dehydrogenase (short-subunit alcohol dehydrogenase family)|nr:SDR family oxidoreductase [Deltaproteobacteria bacterium]MBW2500891.1 SDR family oxidoreductase [Deltaproteobacteria bacterium]
MRLENRRVLVIGASSGIGAASGVEIAAEGGRVAFAARRVDRIEALASQAGNDAIAVACDVRDEASCQAAVERTLEEFGGLDALVYVPGISPFVALREADAKSWREVLDTNLVGATVMMRAAVDALEASCGKAVFISSISIDDSPPRCAAAPYVVSKVALEALVRAWQGEHKRVGFTTIAMGDTLTEFGQNEDAAALIPIIEDWVKRGIMYGRMMDVSSVAAQVVNALASPETVRRIAITPHYPHEGDGVPDDWGRSALEIAREAQRS